MPFVDFIKDNVGKYIPQQRKPGIPMPVSSGGIGNGIASFEDEMPLSKPAIVFYTLQIFFSFIAMCCFASVAAFQAHWGIGVSGLSGFAILVSVTGMILSAVLLLVPVIYDKYDRLIVLARAMREERVAFILSTTGTVLLLLISFVCTISAFTEPGCKNADNDPHAKLGDTFKEALGGWCITKKAGAFFFWFAFLSWCATFSIVIMEWRQGKSRVRPRDPPFVNPIEHSQEDSDAASSYYPVPTPGAGNRPLSHITEDEEEPQSPFADQPLQPRYGNMPAPTLPPIQQSRQSLDTYGAFSDPVPTGFMDPPEGVSRTMAYADPYAAVRANIGPRIGTPGAQAPPSYNP